MKNLLLSMIFALVAVNSWAQIEINGISYRFLNSKNVEVVSHDTKYFGDIIIPSSVEYNGIIYSVTSIGSQAFSGCSGLKSISIPTSVTNIKQAAFMDCSGLTSIDIPNSVISIGNSSFWNCNNFWFIRHFE